ncbi:MAG: NAD-dependent succinate-semialdehyde dehydrogenase [Bacteroidales bacterium]|nr:NAD-dependent succinate-semialdehyde dehydrogenase [Bacteroidales bacterium]MCF8343771.1 NAD-dependent succinate-semialdehyde dehydrogenase [Bacteroidales bacterium]MCF8351636.1 NAD-dependent succinate-semialdehyde dehydrogenase [Bacteroidales bacterium]MCF8375236.1 NAD-dependent succinate-semialdehyde dehydrogenase [Bacteroidales bacterium]MCF8400260.1 NAD-dependent succinate-semialdehyde dehydrogenase [Bacteroidales bacterium]
MKSINPYNNKIIREYKKHTFTELDDKIRSSALAFGDWSKRSIKERCELMRNVAKVLRNKKDGLGQLITLEMGKLIGESVAEIEKCAWVCEYYADHAPSHLEDEIIETDASKSFVGFEPLGVVLAVMPWNFPFWQVFRFAAPALIAGNTALLKHASNVPGCALAIEEIFVEAGFPQNIFTTFLIPSAMVQTVIRNKLVKAVTLTGSELAGSKVAEQAGHEIKKQVLELGGSDPFVVLKDANLEKATETAVKARMINAGQSCIAAKRFILEKDIYDEFLERTKALFQKLGCGDPMKESTTVAPLARPDLVDDIERQVNESVEAGAELLSGGRKAGESGNFYEPALMINVEPDMTVFKEETFGPVMPLVRAKSEKHAIELANHSSFGLGASLWTSDRQKAQQLARDIKAGSVFINGLVKSDPRLPFGGIKKSGYGRELSQFGIREFVNVKTVWMA